MSELKADVILKGDCIEMLRTLPDASVDMVFADPPYFMQLGGALSQRLSVDPLRGVTHALG